MGERRPMGAVDTIWLHMDRPENLMVIDSVMWFDDPVDYARLKNVLMRRLVHKYPVFHQRPVDPNLHFGLPHWEDDPEFDLRHHLHRGKLPAPGDEPTLQRYVEKLVHRPLSWDHPLWEVHLVSGYQGGSAVVMRFHHCMADGIALAQVMLSLTDPDPDGDLQEAEVAHEVDDLEARVGATSRGMTIPVLSEGGALVSGAANLARGAASRSLHLLGDIPHLATTGAAMDALTLVGQTGSIANKLLLGTKPRTTLSGPPGLEKRTRWSQPRSLSDVKKVGRKAGATVNDVLVSAVSGAVSSYLEDQGDDPLDLTTMVPINLRPLDKPLPRELGNQFALVFLSLPSGLRSPMMRLAETKRRMDVIKSSPEAFITFGLINAIGRTHPDLERLLVNFFADKSIGVTTNVAGPTTGRYLAGSRVVGVLGWVPGSGEQTLGTCIFTYDNTVRVGFKADAGSVPNPDKLVEAFETELDDLGKISAAV